MHSLTQSRTPAQELAAELMEVVYKFAKVANKAEQLSSTQPTIWSQLIGELASQSLQSTLTASGLGSVDDAGRDQWRHRFEASLMRELQIEADKATQAAASGRITPQFSGGSSGGHGSSVPISPTVEVNGSPLPVYAGGVAFSSAPGALGAPFGYNDGDPLSAHLVATGMSVDPAYSAGYGAPNPSTAYQPSSFQSSHSNSPFQQEGPSDLSFSDPASSFASASAYPTAPAPSFRLPSPAPPPIPASSGEATPLLAESLGADPSSYNPADLAAAFERMSPSFGQQLAPDWQQSLMVSPADAAALYPLLRERASSSSLPRLVTQDLSASTPGTASGMSAASGSSLAPPSFGAVRPRSRSHGAQERPGQFTDMLSPTTAGSHRRGSSAGSHSPRFHPFCSPGASPVLGTSPGPSFEAGAFGSLAAPSSAAASTSGHRRTKSASHPARTERTLAYDPNAVFYTNKLPVFAVHLQNSTKAEVSERDLIELVLPSEAELSEAPRMADGSEPPKNEGTGLWAATYEGQEYDSSKRAEDAAVGRTYTFVSAPPEGTVALRMPDSQPQLNRSNSSPIGSPALKTYWLVSFSPAHPYSPTIVPLAPTQRTAFSPTLTFLHFPPGMVTLTPHPFGSKEFWRVQSCPGRHDKQPGDGSWTGRWDADGEERRPSRILLHFATCNLRKGAEEEFTLGRLARAIRAARGKGA